MRWPRRSARVGRASRASAAPSAVGPGTGAVTSTCASGHARARGPLPPRKARAHGGVATAAQGQSPPSRANGARTPRGTASTGDAVAGHPLQTTPGENQKADRVKITLPIHPLKGGELPVLRVGRDSLGRRYVVVEPPHGTPLRHWRQARGRRRSSARRTPRARRHGHARDLLALAHDPEPDVRHVGCLDERGRDGTRRVRDGACSVRDGTRRVRDGARSVRDGAFLLRPVRFRARETVRLSSPRRSGPRGESSRSSLLPRHPQPSERTACASSTPRAP